MAAPLDCEIDQRASGGGQTARQWLEEHSTADVTFTPDGVLVEYNAAAERMFRVPPGVDMHGENVLRYCAMPGRLAEVVGAVQLTGRIENWDCEFLRMDGTSIHTVVNIVGNFDSSRALQSLRAHIFNITEWRRGQERTLFGHRAEALGRLAGGVAHDFNNLLTVIMGHAERLQAASAGSALQGSAAAILDASARAAALTRQLLAFARRQVLQPRDVNLNELLRTVEGDVRRTFGRRITVAVDLDPSLATVRIDPDQIEDVLDTLAAHSVEAMAQGGTLTLRSRQTEIGADRPTALCFVQPGAYVQIQVVHDGSALDHDTQMRLFEPFFSDGGAQPRPNLGLAAAFGVVKQSGGYIWADSAAGSATIFTILFPIEARAAVAVAPDDEAMDISSTILVVDDEEPVRRFVGDALRASGYQVIEAGGAADAEQLASGLPGRLDLVVADVNLAGESGADAVAHLRRRIPDLRALYVSGCEDEERLGDAAGAGFLQKPFSAARLVERVRRLLAE